MKLLKVVIGNVSSFVVFLPSGHVAISHNRSQRPSPRHVQAKQPIAIGLHEGGERLTMAHFGMAQDLRECRIDSERVEPRVPSHHGEGEVAFLDGAGEEGQCGGRVAVIGELPGKK